MCVLAFAWRAHPRWRLVAAGNRDELHTRPTTELAHWEAPDDFLAGRDLQSGGTWLGVSEEGRFAVVTNVRGYGLAQPGRPSRGALVADLGSAESERGDHHVGLPEAPSLVMMLTAVPSPAIASRKLV